jgi:hypothetical protein
MVTLGICFVQVAFGQPETDIYLADLEIGSENISVASPVNISNNPGYDNQPSFLEDGTLLYSRTRNGQTDIARYNPENGTTSWISNTLGGSEYSPLKIPGREAVSAIRLDTTGLQRLYAYPLQGGDPTLLVEGLKIGYHLWVSQELLVCTVLVEDRMDLVVVNFKDDSRHTFQKDVGRSLMKIPKSGRISYLTRENDTMVVKAMDPVSGATELINTLPDEVQDLVWLPNGTLLCGYGNKLLGYQPGRDPDWRILQTLPPEMGRITRMSVNPDGRELALTIGPDPQVPVDHQIYAFNTKDLETYLQAFTDDVEEVELDYPDLPLCKGKESLKQTMDLRFTIRSEARYEIIHRTILGNKVIDDVHLALFNGYERFMIIYEIDNGLISRVTYIYPEP